MDVGGGLEIIVGWGASLLPIVVFLVGLVLLDSYKLVGPRSVARSLAAGAAAAVLAFLIHSWLLARTGLDLRTFSRYLAPLVEEGAKAAFLFYLIRSHRVGFLVDAAIHGFASGAGFALVENVYYLHALAEASPLTWIARGFGTAIMHGGTTALFGIVAKVFFERAGHARVSAFVPGLALAYGLHSLFNHFLLSPLLSAAILLVVLPLLIVLVFHRSEEATRAWLGAGFDTDEELLRLLSSQALTETRVGRYLHALRSRFSGEVVGDMFCLLHLRAELSIRAKGVLILRNEGFEVPPDPTIRAKFAEVAYLEESIGAAGLLALDPLLPANSRERWQRMLLSDS
jgi:protease PrsW